VAGRFYPAEAAKLEAAIKGYLADAMPPYGGKPVALVSPHAGYVYSGQVAADAFRQAQDYDYEVVVVLGTNHTTPRFDGVSVYDGRGYRTPLGLAPIDRELTRALLDAHRSFEFRPEVHAREHSIEVQLPFVQVAFPKARIVAAVVGRPDLGLCKRFGTTLAKLLEGRKALIVASSDLSHYPDYDDAVAVDTRSLEVLARMDPSALQRSYRNQLSNGKPGLSTCACGEAPTLAALYAARELGASRAVVVSYANSGDTLMGDLNRVVGYGAVALYAGPGKTRTHATLPPAPPAEPEPLTDAHKKALLAFARKSLERYLASDSLPLPRGFPPALWQKQGAFVTLKKHGELRGCTGHMAEDLPLARVVGRMALNSALNDRRFSPVQPKELSELEIEISVLTPMKRVPSAKAIRVGRDGVVLAKAGRRAVFLPQVATEQGWDRDTMLDRLCRKAGLEAGCWREGAELRVFQAVVFSEGAK
jgi:AmmeMemoRadiSam system protein B/AmmeMemoRadiSam system protein A